LATSLSGCGSDGEDGATGAAGPPGGTVVVVEDPDTLVLTITDVEIVDGYPVVSLQAETETGFAITTLTAGNLRFTFAKLTPGTNGNSSAWQSYINQTEVADGPGPGTVDTIQATSDRNGILINNNDGTYAYTFVNDVTNVTAPLAVEWEPTLTHRVAIQVSGFPATNPIYDFIPATGATTGLTTREIVMTDSCNECHNPLALHGGGRIETQLCVTCHNPGTTDANSGNTVDFKVMIHKIHYGAELTAGPYQIWGFRDRLHDYSDIHTPMDVRNCDRCHDAADSATPDGGNWEVGVIGAGILPTVEACSSCHDDVDPTLGVAGNHDAGVAQNGDCLICHESGQVAGSVAESHQIPGQVWAARFEYEIISVVDTDPGDFPTITFSAINPQTGDGYDFSTDSEYISSGASLNIDIGYSTTDYTNEDLQGNPPARVFGFSGLGATPMGSGVYEITSPSAIPLTATGSGAVAIEGHPRGAFDDDGLYDDNVPVTGVVAYFPITDAVAVPRREVVDITNCQNCHGVNDGLSLHGSNRTDNIELCVLCHNPDNTDVAQRPSDPDATWNGVNTAAADGIEQRSIDFKYMIHSIHAVEIREEPYIVQGFRNSTHDYSDIHFPGDVSDCETCHIEGTYTLPLAGQETRLSTTIDTGATVLVSNNFGNPTYDDPTAATDPSDDLNITPIAAACSACHDSTDAVNHMILNGSGFAALQSDVDIGLYPETCSVCHGEGRIADVETVHEGND
jgi:OmcA/MtrC family decaheme c-type cytochrome